MQYTSFFANCRTLEELKKEYKKLAMRWHPDRQGGNLEKMQLINAEYDRMFAKLKNTRYDSKKDTYYETKQETKETSQDYIEIINELMKCKGLMIEVCGAWLWISGETRQHKDKLKSIGCKWSKNKKLWYWRKEEYRAWWNRRSHSMEEIRNKYGSFKYRPDDEPI